MTNAQLILRNISQPFSLDYIGSTRPHLIRHGMKMGSVPESFRVNHFLIKRRDSMALYLDNVPEELHDVIREAYLAAPVLKGRYIYLTFDQGWVEAATTQRDGGWHIDGLQGDEVPVKLLGDFCFMVSDALPTQFYYGQMYLSDCSVSNDNIFKRIDERVVDVEANSMKTMNHGLYFFDYAAIHRGTPASVRTYRRLCRIHFTETPITSVKMTINTGITYDYKVHQTSGNIPAYLV